MKLHTRGVEKADVKIQGSDNTQYYIRRAGQLIYGKQNFFNGAIGIVPVMLDKYESTKDVPAFDIDKAVDVYWIYLYLARPETYEPQELNCTGTGSKRFHVSDFLNMPVTIPRLEEQQKISKYLKTYEYLITLHQRKLDKIKAIKKAYLSEMFPQNGEKKPRRRFKGFTDDWEQRKLGDIFIEYSEKNHTELPPLTIVQGKGTIRRDESDRQLQFDESGLSSYKMVDKDDFIVHLRSFEGGLEKANSVGIVSPAYHMFHGVDIDPRLYYEYFRSYYFIKVQLIPHVYGIRDGRSIDIEGMKSIKIPYPNLNEQKRIGDRINELNKHITLHQCKQ